MLKGIVENERWKLNSGNMKGGKKGQSEGWGKARAIYFEIMMMESQYIKEGVVVYRLEPKVKKLSL